MIGPLLHAPRREPRSAPLLPGPVRRLESEATHWVERLTAPLGRWHKKPLVVERQDVRLRDLAPAFDGYRIAFLTDLHYSAVVPRAWIARAVAVAMELAPDLILLGGDYVSHRPDYTGALVDLLRPLTAPDGVLAVLGNHDHYVGAVAVRDALARAGVAELWNTAVTIRRGAGREGALAVAGVGDLQYDAIHFDAALRGVPERVPRIVLSHDPDVFAYWPSAVRLDLMLSGHTHGGQAHLPLLGPPFVPSQFGFRYLAGAFEADGRRLYVSRGVGAITAPIRWRCPPEITLLVLHPA